MKLIIAGGRDYQLTVGDLQRLFTAVDMHSVTEIVSGGARGVDTEGELLAQALKIPLKRFPADWHYYGKRAGFVRNREMAQYADAVALFPGGRGTANMREQAEALGIAIYDFRQPKTGV